jgi:AraC-like DNA-binding protein
LLVFENTLEILTGTIGLFTLLGMAFSYSSNKLINFFLFVAIGLVSLRFIVSGSFELLYNDDAILFINILKSISLFNAPLLYLYFKSIAYDENSINKRSFVHLILPTIFSFYIYWFYQSSYFGNPYFKVFNLVFILFLIAFYVWKSFVTLKENVWKNKHEVHLIHFKLIRNWTAFLFTICCLLILRLVLSFSVEILENNAIGGNPFQFIQCFIWLVIFAKILITPEILFGLPHLTKRINQISLNQVEIDGNWKLDEIAISNVQDLKLKEKLDIRILGYIEDLEHLVLEQHYFRNHKITIIDVANELGVPVSHLVYLFKYHSKLSFTEYKTKLKIEDAKKLIEKGFLSTNTLESLAAEVGFASYNPFFTAFKKREGMSPNEYAMAQFEPNSSNIVRLKVLK